MQDSYENRRNIIKASRILQSKVGAGEIDQAKISKMQKIIDDSPVDFAPMAGPLLDELKAAIDKARKTNTGNDRALIAAMTAPVMQIKANASMFKYTLVGRLAGIVLDLLENISTLDTAIIEIVEAHHKTLDLIVSNRMTGDGGNYGAQLEAELRDACKRYFVKYGGEIAFVESSAQDD